MDGLDADKELDNAIFTVDIIGPFNHCLCLHLLLIMFISMYFIIITSWKQLEEHCISIVKLNK